MSSAIISVDDLSKRFPLANQSGRYTTVRDKIVAAFSRKKQTENHAGEFWALKNLSFEIQEGECWGIIGHNGAGKSTLLKILSRVIPPTTGEILIKGRIASILEVGVGFHPELTGRENLFLNGILLGMRKAEIKQKFDEIVEFAELNQFIDQPIKHYSSGMYMRLGFSIAAHLDAEIKIIDEALAVGDPAFQKKCLTKMEEISQSGKTILFVSHDLAAVKRLCKNVLILKNGQSVYQGSLSNMEVNEEAAFF